MVQICLSNPIYQFTFDEWQTNSHFTAKLREKIYLFNDTFDVDLKVTVSS